MRKRIVLATFGSLGDLHPFLALAIGLRDRGCAPVIATHELYRNKIEKLGLEFAPLRPDYDPNREDLNLLSMDPWRGTEMILREGLLPHLRDTYNDLERAVNGASLLVSHAIVFAAPLLAEKENISWISASLSPISLLSATDPPHAAPVPWLNRMWSFGSPVNRLLLEVLRRKTARWCEPIAEFRKELGLPTGLHPLFEGQHSPLLALALFSSVLGEPQPDWPASVRQTGFCFLDDAGEMPRDLQRYLDDGPPPVVVTLGSAAVLTAGDFFIESARAIAETGSRAVFIAGKELRISSGKNVFVTPYAPYSQVFGRSAIVVHQGGVGTTAQGLRAARPALIVPFAHDQPDNAMRIARAGVGSFIPRAKYNSKRAAVAIHRLMTEAGYRNRAEELAKRVAREDGVDTACGAILNAVSG